MKELGKAVNDSIRCPHCGELIAITETLRHQFTEQARAELQEELLEQQKALSQKEKLLQGKEVKLKEAEADIENRITKRIASEKANLTKDALEKARSEVAVEIADLQANTEEKERKLREAQGKELELRKEKRELEAAKAALELDVARKIDAERNQIREDARKEASEEHQLRDAEKDQRLQEALKVNNELHRKLQQGSQQIQGEVMELELEGVLRDSCPFDEILPVSKGVRGADVLHKVNTRAGLPCGSIIWEAKHTKNWSETWIAKLKEDQSAAKADTAVLVSEVLPEGIKDFDFVDGVWVTARRHVRALTVALRQSLSEIAQAKRAVASKNETIDALFNYVTGPEFRNRVEAIARSFTELREDLEKEKRSTARAWAKREKQLDLIVASTGGMYGELQAFIGASLKGIPALEAGDPDSGEEDTGLTMAAQAK